MEKVVAIAALVALASVGLSSAALYTIEDGAGWAIPSNVSYYNTWASTKHFEVGDVLRFVYDQHFHNVLMVTRENYLACNTWYPARSFRSGDESITLRAARQYYFICGAHGHCARGQKLRATVYVPEVK